VHEASTQHRLHDSSSAFTAGQLVTSERGVCGGPLALHYANLMSHLAFRQSLACVESLIPSSDSVTSRSSCSPPPLMQPPPPPAPYDRDPVITPLCVPERSSMRTTRRQQNPSTGWFAHVVLVVGAVYVHHGMLPFRSKLGRRRACTIAIACMQLCHGSNCMIQQLDRL
jgi:hypothetical protein